MSKPKQAHPQLSRLAGPVQSPLSKTLKPTPTPKPKPKLKGYGGKTKTTGSKIKSLKGYGQTNKNKKPKLTGFLGSKYKSKHKASGGKIMQGYKKGGKV